MPKSPKLLTSLRITEVSSVDRGAGHNPRVVLMKRQRKAADDPLAKLFELAETAGADSGDVANARTALAKCMVAIDENIDGDDEQDAAFRKSLDQCVAHLAGLVPDEERGEFEAAAAATISKVEAGDDDMKPEDVQKLLDETLKKALAPVQAQNEALTLELAVMKMSEDHRAYHDQIEKAEDKTAFAKADDKGRADIIRAKPPKKKPAEGEEDGSDVDKRLAKLLEESPIVKKLQADLDKANETVAKMAGNEQVTTLAKRLADAGLPAAHAPVLAKALAGDKDAIEQHLKLIKGLTAQADTSELFKQFGSDDASGAGATAYQQLRSKAEELRKADTTKKMSIHQAMAKVMSDPENKELVARNKAEELARKRAA